MTWFGSHLLVVPATGALPGPAVPAVPAIAVAPVAAVPGLPGRSPRESPPGQVLAGRFALHHLDRDQRQLAAVVDLADLDLDLVADVHYFVDVLDPPAAVQLADLRDVQQAVLAGQQRDERADVVVFTTVPRNRSPTSGMCGLAIALIAARAASAGRAVGGPRRRWCRRPRW